MGRRNRDPWKASLLGLEGLRRLIPLAFLGLLFVPPALFACSYSIKLKDKVDEPGTETYNRENCGNVIVIPTPQRKAFQLPARATRPVSVPSDSWQSADRVLWGGPAVRRQFARRDGRRSGSPSNP